MKSTTAADKTEKVGITLPNSLVKQVDKMRGDIPRSTFIRSHPGVRSHISSSMELPHNTTGFSDTVKIMPNGSAAEIGRPHTVNQTLTSLLF